MEGDDIPEVDLILVKIDEYLSKLNTTEGIKMYRMIKEIHDLLIEVKKLIISKNIFDM
jgi:hypothetical protein